MRILHVQETLASNYGGPAEVLPKLAAAQKAAGHHVEIVTTNCDLPHGTYHVPGWGVIEDGDVPTLYGRAEFSLMRASLEVARYLRGNITKFDIVHVHGLYRFPPTYAAYQARKQDVPYIIRPHGSLDPFLYGKSSRSVWLKRLYERLFDFPNLQAADAIHFTAEDERRRVSFLGLQAPSFVVPNGVDWKRFRELPTRGTLRARWGLGDGPVILFVGRLHFKKGLDLLVPAFEMVRQRIPNVQLVIAGPENDGYGMKVRGWVRERTLEESVHLVGPLEGADVLRAYVDADVFALPSYTENFGMTVVEAMACRLPVVISDQVNIHSEVGRSGAGVVIRCERAELADAIRSVLDDPDRRRAMGTAGRRLVCERFTWGGIINSLTTQYELVIERHQRTARR